MVDTLIGYLDDRDAASLLMVNRSTFFFERGEYARMAAALVVRGAWFERLLVNKMTKTLERVKRDPALFAVAVALATRNGAFKATLGFTFSRTCHWDVSDLDLLETHFKSVPETVGSVAVGLSIEAIKRLPSAQGAIQRAFWRSRKQERLRQVMSVAGSVQGGITKPSQLRGALLLEYARRHTVDLPEPYASILALEKGGRLGVAFDGDERVSRFVAEGNLKECIETTNLSLIRHQAFPAIRRDILDGSTYERLYRPQRSVVPLEQLPLFALLLFSRMTLDEIGCVRRFDAETRRHVYITLMFHQVTSVEGNRLRNDALYLLIKS